MKGLVLAVLLLASPLPAAAESEEDAWAALQQGGHVLLMRHARAPGTGDPPEFRLDSCGTQRNLDEWGRKQARKFGEELKKRRIPVDRVLTSAWCRSRDTATEMDVGRAEIEPALNYLLRSNAPAEQTEAVRSIIGAWRGRGNLVLITHNQNIKPLTGISPQSGHVIVLKPLGTIRFAIVGRIDDFSG
jgi:phosphohistidine phosphatase SixA